MPSVPRMRNSAHRTLVSTVEVHIGSCWRILVSHDRAGRLRAGDPLIISIRPSIVKHTQTRGFSGNSNVGIPRIIGESSDPVKDHHFLLLVRAFQFHFRSERSTSGGVSGSVSRQTTF